MSWLFGKKKQQKDSPANSSDEKQPSDQNEGFVHVSMWPNDVTQNVGNDSPGYPTGNLYPYVPPLPEFGQVSSSDTNKNSGQTDGSNYLSGVPFKMSKQLERSMNRDIDVDTLRIDEILSFIERVEKESYEYNFSCEKGIVAEMNSDTGGE